MRCVVPSCSNDSGRTSAQDISYFTFPEEQVHRVAWLATGLEPRWRGAVCSRHFLWEDLLQSGEQRSLRPGAVPVTEALVCRICLGTDRKLYSMAEYKSLCSSYEALTGLEMHSEEWLPRFVCAECARQLLAGARFRAASLRAHSVLLEVVAKHRWITVENIIEHQSLLTRNPTYSQADQCDLDMGLFKTEKIHTNEEADTKEQLRFETENNDVTNQLLLKCEISDDVGVTHSELDNHPHDNLLLREVKVEFELDDRGAPNGEETLNADSKSRQIQEIYVPDYVKLEYNDDEVTSAGIDHSSDDNNCFREVRQCAELGTHEAPKGTEASDARVPRQSQDTEGPSTNDDSSCSQTHYQTDYLDNLLSDSNANPIQPHNRYKLIHNTVKKQSSLDKKTSSEVLDVKREKIYPCHVCSKSFSTKGVLRMHLRIHSGEKPYSCEVCSKSFIQASTLQDHLSTHSAKKPYSCDVCGKSLGTKAILQRHVRIHSGEKPYSCEVCSKSFDTNSHLQRHLRIHSGEKPHSCELCSKSFDTNSHLKRHLRTHSGEKPYSCEVCSKSFDTNSHLKRHLRIHTVEKPNSC